MNRIPIWLRWLALVVLVASLLILAWSIWPVGRVRQSVPLPTIQAPLPQPVSILLMAVSWVLWG